MGNRPRQSPMRHRCDHRPKSEIGARIRCGRGPAAGAGQGTIPAPAGLFTVTATSTMPRTILVTGATGFTGGNLARRLAAQGENVRALVRNAEKAQSLAADGIEVR